MHPAIDRGRPGVTPGPERGPLFSHDGQGAPSQPADSLGEAPPHRGIDSWVDAIVQRASPVLDLSASRAESSWTELRPPLFPQCGDRLLGFHLIAELGRGAFGRVYLATQDDLAGRLVALKVSPEAQAESQHLAQLQHTHIVPVYSIHRAGSLQAVCMPFFGSTTLLDIHRDLQRQQAPPASGKSLVGTIRDRVERTRANLDSARAGDGPLSAVAPSARLPGQGVGASAVVVPEVPARLRMLEGLSYVDAVLWIGQCLAQGLAHAHDRGIVHRDLKPANVLLTDDGQPMLLDFNLSADVKIDVGRARVGGTLPYMAPEHLASFAGLPAPFPPGAGTTATVDARSDVYALGVILYELLAGRPPFEPPTGPWQDLIPNMLGGRLVPPPPVRPFNDSVGPAVESIIRHCLEPDPARRYQSARELAEDLDRQSTNRPLAHACEPCLVERATKWVRRNRRLALLSAAAFATVVVVGLTAGLVSRSRVLARMEAAATLSAFYEECDEAHLLLAARPQDAAQRREGLRIARHALARYHLPERSAWREQAEVRRLPPQEQQRLTEAAGELLLLAASADETEQKEALVERAADCFPADGAPCALYDSRADLAEARGDRDAEKSLRDRANQVPPRNARDRCLLARKGIAAGEYARAVEQLREAVRLEPKDFAAWYLLGNSCLDAAALPDLRETEALRCYTVAIALRPGFYGSYHNRGLAHLRHDQYAKAEADFDAALELCPRNAATHLYRGLARQSQDKLAAALDDFNEAIDLGNAPSRAYFSRAKLHRQLGGREAARQDEAEGMRHQPPDEESYIHRGVVRAARDPHGAVADFKQALRLNRHSLPGLYNQAVVLAEQLGAPEKAITLFDRVIERYPHLAGPWANRGLLRARLGQRDASHLDGRQALKRSGKKGELILRVACIHAQTSRSHPADRDEALRLLSRALRLGCGHEQLETNRDLAPLLADPRFRALVGAAQTFAASGLPGPPAGSMP